MPIFPEIRQRLQQAFDEAPAGSVYVLPREFHREGYAYAGVLRAVERASVEPWPKLLQNLRASRETELMQNEPAHVVHAWLGNSREVAEDHYLMVTDADYARASAVPASESAAKDPLSKAVQKAVQSAAVSPLQTRSARNEAAVSPAFAKHTAVQVPPRGVEQSRLCPRKKERQLKGDVKSDVASKNRPKSPLAVDADAIDSLASRLASLPPEVIAALKDIFGGQQQP